MIYPDLRSEFVTLRHEMGMSQPQAAAALDRSASWVRGIEQGQSPCPVYAVLAMRALRAIRELKRAGAAPATVDPPDTTE